MRLNRVQRDQIECLRGPGVVEEIKRWNDLDLDPLDASGVDMSPEEEAAQQVVLQDLQNATLYGYATPPS